STSDLCVSVSPWCFGVLSAFRNGDALDARWLDRLRRLAAAGGLNRRVGDPVEGLHAAGETPEDGVVLRQTAAHVAVDDEELAAVGVRAGVGHGQGARLIVAADRLVREAVAGTAG